MRAIAFGAGLAFATLSFAQAPQTLPKQDKQPSPPQYFFPMCAFSGCEPTIPSKFYDADIIVHATVVKVRGTDGKEALEWHVQKYIKTDGLVGQRKTFPVDKQQTRLAAGESYVLACEVMKREIEPYFGIKVPANSSIPEFVANVCASTEKPQSERLSFFAKYFEHPEGEIATDAHREWGQADYKDYAPVAKSLDPKVLARWLDDPNTLPGRYDLYANLLGHCGTKAHAKLLERLHTRKKSESVRGDGILFGYLQLNPPKAWNYLADCLKREDFWTRYAALRTVRLVYTERWDLIDKNEKKAKDMLVQAMLDLLDHQDTADFAIEDLRRWRRWETTGKVLGLFGQPALDREHVKRAILRFALRSPDPRAAEFVRQQRQRDAAWVRDAEELLDLEDPLPSSE